MLYAIGCVSCGLLVPPWGCIGRILGLLGSTLEQYCALSGQSWDNFGRSWWYLGTHWGLGFRVWGLTTTTHTPLKCQNRSRLTPVQRKRSHEKRRCDQALKSHSLGKCQNRSRITPVQPNRYLVMLLVDTRLSTTAKSIEKL